MTHRISAGLAATALLAAAVSLGAPRVARADEPSPVQAAPPPLPALTGPADARPVGPVLAPSGYRFENRRHKGLVVGGAVGLGLSWAGAVFTGLLGVVASANRLGSVHDDPTPNYALMFIPLAGPFATLATEPPRYRESSMTAILAVLGTSQLAGAAMLITGIANPRRVLVEVETKHATLSVQPIAGPSFGGLQFGGTF